MENLAPPNFMTIGEVADLLRVNRSSIDRWVAEGQFPSPIKFGGSVMRFARSEILAFLDQHKSREPMPSRQRRLGRRGQKQAVPSRVQIKRREKLA